MWTLKLWALPAGRGANEYPANAGVIGIPRRPLCRTAAPPKGKKDKAVKGKTSQQL